MQAIKINPFNQTIALIELDSDDLASIRQQLCWPEANIDVSYFDVFRLGGADVFRFGETSSDVLFVDDEGLYQQNQMFFRVGSTPIAGIALLVGTGADGDSINPTISLDQINYLFSRHVFSWVPSAAQAFAELTVATELAVTKAERAGHAVTRMPFGFITQFN